MRFRFCGDLDCPDWVLAEISTLAKMSSVKLRLLCSQVLKELLGQGIDYEKILKLTADAKFESGDVKATVAVLSFILSSAAKHSVDGESLSSELQQLGLPKELLRSTCRARGQPVPLLRGEAKPLAEALAGLQPTQTEAGSDPDELPGLRRKVFQACVELPCPYGVTPSELLFGRQPWF
nr:COMM domain-containing protein 4 isoform X3 [Symphalangus syndactylus]